VAMDLMAASSWAGFMSLVIASFLVRVTAEPTAADEIHPPKDSLRTLWKMAGTSRHDIRAYPAIFRYGSLVTATRESLGFRLVAVRTDSPSGFPGHIPVLYGPLPLRVSSARL